MQEISTRPLVDILTEITGRTVVMKDTDYVYLDTKRKVVSEKVEQARAIREDEKRKESIKFFTSFVENYIYEPIKNYNEANGTLFESVHNCATYMPVENYPHRDFCIKAVNFNANVWETARVLEKDITDNNKPIPTEEELALQLPKFGE